MGPRDNSAERPRLLSNIRRCLSPPYCRGSSLTRFAYIHTSRHIVCFCSRCVAHDTPGNACDRRRRRCECHASLPGSPSGALSVDNIAACEFSKHICLSHSIPRPRRPRDPPHGPTQPPQPLVSAYTSITCILARPRALWPGGSRRRRSGCTSGSPGSRVRPVRRKAHSGHRARVRLYRISTGTE